LSNLGLRNKIKQIIVGTMQQETSSSTNTKNNKKLQIAEIENFLYI